MFLSKRKNPANIMKAFEALLELFLSLLPKNKRLRFSIIAYVLKEGRNDCWPLWMPGPEYFQKSFIFENSLRHQAKNPKLKVI